MRRLMIGLAGALAVVLAGCLGPRDVTVSVDAGSAQVEPGQTLRVDFGDVNQSVGDSWYLVGEPDMSVLTNGGQDFDPDCANPGCGGRLAWTFTAVRSGRTDVTFQYCYRSRLGEDCASAPSGRTNQVVTLAVTVT
jgi:predicted secreted protein